MSDQISNILRQCNKGNHKFEKIFSCDTDLGHEEFVLWCTICGAVAIGDILKTESPRNCELVKIIS